MGLVKFFGPQFSAFVGVTRHFLISKRIGANKTLMNSFIRFSTTELKV